MESSMKFKNREMCRKTNSMCSSVNTNGHHSAKQENTYSLKVDKGNQNALTDEEEIQYSDSEINDRRCRSVLEQRNINQFNLQEQLDQGCIEVTNCKMTKHNHISRGPDQEHLNKLTVHTDDFEPITDNEEVIIDDPESMKTKKSYNKIRKSPSPELSSKSISPNLPRPAIMVHLVEDNNEKPSLIEEQRLAMKKISDDNSDEENVIDALKYPVKPVAPRIKRLRDAKIKKENQLKTISNHEPLTDIEDLSANENETKEVLYKRRSVPFSYIDLQSGIILTSDSMKLKPKYKSEQDIISESEEIHASPNRHKRRSKTRSPTSPRNTVNCRLDVKRDSIYDIDTDTENIFIDDPDEMVAIAMPIKATTPSVASTSSDYRRESGASTDSEYFSGDEEFIKDYFTTRLLTHKQSNGSSRLYQEPHCISTLSKGNEFHEEQHSYQYKMSKSPTVNLPFRNFNAGDTDAEDVFVGSDSDFEIKKRMINQKRSNNDIIRPYQMHNECMRTTVQEHNTTTFDREKEKLAIKGYLSMCLNETHTDTEYLE